MAEPGLAPGLTGDRLHDRGMVLPQIRRRPAFEGLESGQSLRRLVIHQHPADRIGEAVKQPGLPHFLPVLSPPLFPSLSRLTPLFTCLPAKIPRVTAGTMYVSTGVSTGPIPG
jgi:hypothetical protein